MWWVCMDWKWGSVCQVLRLVFHMDVCVTPQPPVALGNIAFDPHKTILHMKLRTSITPYHYLYLLLCYCALYLSEHHALLSSVSSSVG